ncbi:hypothetical protein, partial [Stutzerimonas stutzeri]|uniref:hypothetical protein n=1 Tax=Stutzerimonas stutzeri TaxID=316 RepID=UPI0024B72A81
KARIAAGFFRLWALLAWRLGYRALRVVRAMPSAAIISRVATRIMTVTNALSNALCATLMS